MKKLWLIKDKKGRIFGPYNEEEVCFHIEEGEFKGEEFFSSYPAGKWNPLSTHPVFYEKILAQINKLSTDDSSQTSELSENDSLKKEPIEPTRIITPKPSFKKEKVKIKLSKQFKKEILEEEGFNDIIEMENVNEKFLDKLKHSIKIPVLLLIIVTGALSFNYFFNSDQI
ncbi:MAG: hypothetical protein OXN83_05140, partial [Oligoflexia bacterium]|nr:hypothetical protein [Oligoflexia bacterium]